MMKFFAVFALLGSVLSIEARALPIDKDGHVRIPKWTPGWLEKGLSQVDFTGIIKLNNCSGSMIRYENTEPDDLVLVLTNGHCVGMLEPGSVVFDRTSRRRIDLLNPNGRTEARVLAKRIIYATMTKTDLALYELSITYKELAERYNLEALLLADKPAEAGDTIEVISGYWRRGYSCMVDSFIHELREADWTFVNSIKYSKPGCEVIGGTSGSPIVNSESRLVIGVNNTGNERGRECTMNNPCEVDEDGNITVDRGAGYGQQTYWIYSCLDADRQIDLEKEGCLLPKGEEELELRMQVSSRTYGNFELTQQSYQL